MKSFVLHDLHAAHRSKSSLVLHCMFDSRCEVILLLSFASRLEPAQTHGQICCLYWAADCCTSTLDASAAAAKQLGLALYV